MGLSTTYRVRSYPTAREATVFPSSWAGARVSLANGGLGHSALSTPGGGSSVLDQPSQLDHDPNDRRSDNVRRAVGRVRRYVAHNRLSVLVTTTYADDHLERAGDRFVVAADGRDLVRRMRRAWGEPFPYVLTVEAQPQRSARRQSEVFNTMLITPSLPRPVFDKVVDSWRWGGGGGYNGVDIDRRRSSGALAAYAMKSIAGYAAKGLGAVEGGRQSYRVGEGFQPPLVERVIADTHNSAAGAARAWAESEDLDVRVVVDLREARDRKCDAAWLSWAS